MSNPRAVSESLLTVSGVHHYYGSYHALDDVSFEVHGGEIAALVGRNGAGKSTLMRCIAGWTPLRDGDVLIDGVSLRQSERAYRQHLLLVPGVPVFYAELTAWENLQFIAQVRGQRGWQEEAERRLSVFGLVEHRNAYPSSFSRGMQYKLALSLALLAQPELLLLDEPFGPLDPLSATALWSSARWWASPTCPQARINRLLRCKITMTTSPDGARPIAGAPRTLTESLRRTRSSRMSRGVSARRRVPRTFRETRPAGAQASSQDSSRSTAPRRFRPAAEGYL